MREANVTKAMTTVMEHGDTFPLLEEYMETAGRYRAAQDELRAAEAQIREYENTVVRCFFTTRQLALFKGKSLHLIGRQILKELPK